MQLTKIQSIKLAFQDLLVDLKEAVFPDPRPSIGYVVNEVTGNGSIRVLGDDERKAVIASLEAYGYDNAEESVEAFELLATIDWSRNAPRP